MVIWMPPSRIRVMPFHCMHKIYHEQAWFFKRTCLGPRAAPGMWYNKSLPKAVRVIKAFILAGGKGAHLRPLALYIPKPVVPLANIPFLFFQIDHIKRAGITEIILGLSYQPRKITDIFGDGMKYGVTMRYTFEDLPRGTAGALKASENLIDDVTVVLNGDVLTDTDIREVIQFHQEHKAEATI